MRRKLRQCLCWRRRISTLTGSPRVLRGLFIIVAGAERAGLTKSLLQPFTRWDLHSVAVFVRLPRSCQNLVSIANRSAGDGRDPGVGIRVVVHVVIRRTGTLSSAGTSVTYTLRSAWSVMRQTVQSV